MRLSILLLAGMATVLVEASRLDTKAADGVDGGIKDECSANAWQQSQVPVDKSLLQESGETSVTSRMLTKEAPIDINELEESLRKNFYAPVPIGTTQKALEDAIQSFMKFLALPEEIKKEIDFRVCKTHRRGEIGYKVRQPSDDLYRDSKEFFHYHPSIFELHGEFVERQPIVKDFLLKAQEIYAEIEEKVQEILAGFDMKFPGCHDKILVPKNGEKRHIVLRFLKYDWAESGKYLAKPHFDSGSLTLAIGESGPGLRIGSCQEDLKLVEHKEGYAQLFISSNFEKVFGLESGFKPGWHDVIQLDQASINRPFSRWAIVAFIEASDVEALSRQETHKYYNEVQ